MDILGPTYFLLSDITPLDIYFWADLKQRDFPNDLPQVRKLLKGRIRKEINELHGPHNTRNKQ